MEDVIRKHIHVVEGTSGPTARLVGSRIRVQDIVFYHETQGWSAFEIAEQLPTITVADVYAALAYYYDNREEIDREIAEEAAFIERMQRESPRNIKEELLQRWEQARATTHGAER